MEPCASEMVVTHAILAVGSVITSALTIFLAHRRILADRERRNGGSANKRRSGSDDLEIADDGGHSDGRPES